MYRKDLDPEISTWDEVVRAAECAEIVQNPESEKDSSTSDNNNVPLNSKSGSHNNGSRHAIDRAGWRVDSKHHADVMHTSSAEMNTQVPGEKKRSAKRCNEMLAQSLCLACEEQGHLVHDCPPTTNVKSSQKVKPPGFGVHGVHLSAAESALYDTTEVLDTLPFGAMNFCYEPPMDVDIPVEFFQPENNGDSKSTEMSTKPIENNDTQAVSDQAVNEQIIDDVPNTENFHSWVHKRRRRTRNI
jgi:hypothetical protein